MTAAVLLLAATGAVLVASGAQRRRRISRRHLALAVGSSAVEDGDVQALGPIELGRVLELWRREPDGSQPVPLTARLASVRRELLAGAMGASGLFLVVTLLTDQPVLGLGAIAVAGFAVSAGVRRRRRRHRELIADQLPDALLLLAGALQAGNPFPRALRTLAERGSEPLAGEFARVVAESDLGVPVIDALDDMAERLDLDDIRWFARAVRIQQSVGGQLGPIIRTTAEVMTARAELQREVRVLTAEGRVSAWVLGSLPVVLVLACNVMNPDYLDPLFHGSGLLLLGGCALSVVAGIACILRMVEMGEGR